MCSLSSKPLCIHEGRHRGRYPGKGVFLIYPHDGKDLILMEPFNVATDWCALWEWVLSANNAVIGDPLAGGNYDTKKFDFAFLRAPDVAIPELFVRLFNTISPNQAMWFRMYLDAQILLRSAPSDFGTIRSVLAKHDILVEA